jgi:hypothetical protein
MTLPSENRKNALHCINPSLEILISPFDAVTYPATRSRRASMPPPKGLSVGKALNDTVDLDAVRGNSMNLCRQFVCGYKWSIPTREQFRHSYKVLLFGRAVTNTEHALGSRRPR